MQEIIKVNIDTGVGLPEDYNIILSTDDEDFSLEKVKGLTNEFSWDNPPPHHILHILVRSFEDLEQFPTYPTHEEVDEYGYVVIVSDEPIHYSEVSKEINWERVLLFHHETIMKEDYKKFVEDWMMDKRRSVLRTHWEGRWINQT